MTWPYDLVTWYDTQTHLSNSTKSCIQLKKRHHPQTYKLRLVLDLHPMSPHKHLVFKLKSYASVSQKAWTIYQPTSSLVSSTRGIVSKEEWLRAICWWSHDLRGIVRGLAVCSSAKLLKINIKLLVSLCYVD